MPASTLTWALVCYALHGEIMNKICFSQSNGNEMFPSNQCIFSKIRVLEGLV